MGLNYRKNKVSDLKLVFTVLINNSSHAAENLKIHRICSSFAWDQWPRINLVSGCPQLPHHGCGVRWSQDLWIPISLEQITDHLHSKWISCFFTAILTPATISCGSALPPLVHHTHRKDKWTRADAATILFSTFWQSLRNLTWQALLKQASQKPGSSHGSGAEFNSFENILGSKLLIHYHSLINSINKAGAQVHEVSTCRSFHTLTPVEDLLHYSEHFHLAQQDFAVALLRFNGIHVCSTKPSQILLSSQFFHVILLPPHDMKYILVSFVPCDGGN